MKDSNATATAKFLCHPLLSASPISSPTSVSQVYINADSIIEEGLQNSSDLILIMSEEENQIELKDEAADLAPFHDPMKKKVVIQDPAEDFVEQLVEKTNSLSVSEILEPTFTGLKKKKKKQIDLLDEEKDNAEEDIDYPIGEDESGEGIDLQTQKLPWEGTDRDYTYEELLGQVFLNLYENNPELAGNRRKIVMRTPQVVREGTKKTVLVNFMDLCKEYVFNMHRQLQHVMDFLLAELGASGSLDDMQRLVVKGRFASKHFEGILRRYFNEYVICNSCKREDTKIEKKNRLFFLICDKCGSERSVAQIKVGFVARVGRRKVGT
ncbi:hypothetical protein L1987_00375 [Smallanthus sonchifolius]|uniref:Uncharacterized protein n=1 Tax=Smallanthus sonchifolius TaxID=185202 RepID=A0ACB9K261_9ASTR|nr:hypothetical protein L1987_00375 [Smallanthus sonchifolius]